MLLSRDPATLNTARSLDYRIHPCILPLLHPSMGYALRAILRLFKFDPVKFVGPAIGCSLKLMDSILNITLSVMARRVSHRDVTNKSAPADLVPIEALGNDDYFLSLCASLKSA